MNTQETGLFPETKKLCRLFLHLRKTRGLISGPGMDFFDALWWRDVFAGFVAINMTADEITEREETSRMAFQFLMICELTDCGLIQTLPLPEPSGEAHPKILALLRGEEIAIVPRPDVF